MELLLRREGGQSVFLSFIFEEGEDDDDSLVKKREESGESVLLLLPLLSIEDAVGS